MNKEGDVVLQIWRNNSLVTILSKVRGRGFRGIGVSGCCKFPNGLLGEGPRKVF